MTVTSTQVSLSDSGDQEAVGEVVGPEDVGHPGYQGAGESCVPRVLVMVTITSTSPAMSPENVAHARSHQSRHYYLP